MINGKLQERRAVAGKPRDADVNGSTFTVYTVFQKRKPPNLEPQAVAVSPYGWLMTQPASRGFYGGGVSYGGLRRLTADWRMVLPLGPWLEPPRLHKTGVFGDG